ASLDAGENLRERLASCAFEKHAVELVLGSEHLLDVAAVDRDLCKPICGTPYRSELFIRGPLNEALNKHRFESRANLVEIDSFIDWRLRHDRTLLGDNGDEPFGRELAQHLTNGGARDSYTFDQFAFDEPLPGLQFKIQDRITNEVEYLLTQWC